MNPSLYFNLWKNHPGRGVYPCDKSQFQNQCAIRMSTALHLSNVDISSFSGAKCWVSHEDGFKHILRAQELADWMHIHPENSVIENFMKRKSILNSITPIFGK